MRLPQLARASMSLAQRRAPRLQFIQKACPRPRPATKLIPVSCNASTITSWAFTRSFSTQGSVRLQEKQPTTGVNPVPPSLQELQQLDKPLEKKNGKIQDDDFDDIEEGRGKLSPTSSHLFKLILPLGGLDLPAEKRKSLYTVSDTTSSHSPGKRAPPPTIMLLHPSQPLSHVASLIRSSIRSGSDKSRRANPGPEITFVSTSTRGQPYQWSETTDVGDFVRDAARKRNFSVELDFSESESQSTSGSDKVPPALVTIQVDVPTFHDRTSFLRRRLFHIQSQLKQMEGLKLECDKMAHRGAKRLAIGGFGMLVVYWGAVARLTFWDYGWDVMEPVTYLSGLTTVVCGYLWFLYQGRDVSYSSVLHRSVNARREALYREKGFDIDRWTDLKEDERSVQREIGRIAEEYDVETTMGETEGSTKKTRDTNDDEQDTAEDGVDEKVEKAGDEVEKVRQSVEDVEDKGDESGGKRKR